MPIRLRPFPSASRRLRALLATATALSCVGVAGAAAQQATQSRDVDPIALMNEDLAAKRYDEVIRRGNQLLGSSRSFTVAEQVRLWQVMAAAYYPPDPLAQRPDSARLPLDALVRIAPDIALAEDLRWAGLDSLLERSRAGVFVIASRPLASYEATLAEPAHITVVSSRPARFRLSSVSQATGVVVVHDSAAVTRQASLRLRVHDGTRVLVGAGDHELRIVAIDAASGDSLLVTHRVRARANTSGPTRSLPPFIPPATVRVSSMKRGMLIAGGALFAGATVALANGGRAGEPIRSAFSMDGRALLVGGAMLAAAVGGLFMDDAGERPATAADVARARAAYDRRVAAGQAEARRTAARYRVTIDFREATP